MGIRLYVFINIMARGIDAACPEESSGNQTVLRIIFQPLKKYPDAASVADYAKDAVAFCAEQAILESDRTELRPGEAICRCEVAQMVWNLLKAAGEV